MTAPTIAPFTSGSAKDFALWAQELREARITAASDLARIRIFDGNWIERGEVIDLMAGTATVSLNQAGSILSLIHI